MSEKQQAQQLAQDDEARDVIVLDMAEYNALVTEVMVLRAETTRQGLGLGHLGEVLLEEFREICKSPAHRQCG
jgi:ribosomal silencing factor RsfS